MTEHQEKSNFTLLIIKKTGYVLYRKLIWIWNPTVNENIYATGELIWAL